MHNFSNPLFVLTRTCTKEAIGKIFVQFKVHGLTSHTGPYVKPSLKRDKRHLFDMRVWEILLHNLLQEPANLLGLRG